MKSLLVLFCVSIAWGASPPVTNARRLGGKPLCSATVTTNCVPSTGTDGSVAVGTTMLGPKTIGAGASQLPAAAAGNSGYVTVVTDSTDCVNAGVGVSLCRSNGAAWVPLGDGSGTGPWTSDGAGGWEITGIIHIYADGTIEQGDGTLPWNLTGLTDDAAPGAPGSANQFTAYVDRSDGLLKWHLNGEGSPKVAMTTAASVASSQLPFPGASDKGGILTTACASGYAAKGYKTDGTPDCVAVGGSGGTRIFFSGGSSALVAGSVIGIGAFHASVERQVQFQAPATGTLSDLRVDFSGSAGSGNTLTLTIRLNGADTALACTVSDGSTTTHATCVNSADTVAVTAGDLLNGQLTGSGSPPSVTVTASVNLQ